MKIVFSNQFLKSVARLPLKIQLKLDRLLEILQLNPYNSLLHTKKLSGELSDYYSFRITRDWRVIFCLLNSLTIQLLRAAHRKEIYR